MNTLEFNFKIKCVIRDDFKISSGVNSYLEFKNLFNMALFSSRIEKRSPLEKLKI